jgi:hypothetical protein
VKACYCWRDTIPNGYPPYCIELITTAFEVDFKPCYAARAQTEIDGVQVNFIDPEDLK